MRAIAGWIDEGLTADENGLARIRAEVLDLTAGFPVPER
jgi:hypothetical protein